MPATRAAVSTRQWRAIPLAAALSAALALSCNADAATLGHTRIVSAPGQPLRIDVPIVRLSAQELRTLHVTLAPAAAWAQAGLVPPAELSSLRVGVDDGPQPGMRIVHVTSSQAFNRPVADLLLEVQTSAGRQQYQVSVLASTPRSAASAGGAAGAARTGEPGTGHAAQPAAARIHVRNGDYLFALAQRHAVPGVTVYQMMVGLLRANPRAFIHANMNLVKAGATLRVPDVSVLTSISDREARRIFEEQALEFARYRQRLAAAGMAEVPDGAADRGTVTAATAAAGSPPAARPRDRLKLSSGAADDARADDSVALRKGIADSRGRISELEGNIDALGQALHGQQGGGKASAAGSGRNGASASGSIAGGALLASASASGTPGAAGAKSAGAGSSAGSTREGSGASATGPDGRQPDAVSDGSMRAQPGAGQAANDAAQQGQAGQPGMDMQSGQGATAGQAGKTGQGEAGTAAGGSAAQGSGIAGTAVLASPDSGAAGANSAAGAAGATAAASSGSGTAGAGAATPSGSGTAGAGAATSSGSGIAGAGAAAASGSGAAASGSGSSGSSSGAAAHSGGQEGGAADAGSAGSATQQTSNKAGQPVSWIQEHMLGVITGLLALIVLIIAWLLRRANIARDDDGDDHPSAITEAMVQEKLDKINLDLSQPPSDEPPAAKP